MTTNQIAFFKAKEEQQHNRVVERETAAHNRITENEAIRHAMRQEAIDSRRNDITEAYNVGTLAHYATIDTEQQRSNRENERIKREQNLENIRHDMSQEQIEREKNQLTRQANVVRTQELAETHRHQTVTENLSAAKNVAEIENLRAQTQSTKSNTLLDTVRLDNITSQTLLNLEKTKQTGWESLLTEQKIYSEQALTNLRKEQTNKTGLEAGYLGINTWSNAIGGVGRLISGLKGLPVIQMEEGIDWNAYYTGVY